MLRCYTLNVTLNSPPGPSYAGIVSAWTGRGLGTAPALSLGVLARVAGPKKERDLARSNEDTVAVYVGSQLVAIYESAPRIAWREALLEARAIARNRVLPPARCAVGVWSLSMAGSPCYVISDVTVTRIASPLPEGQ